LTLGAECEVGALRSERARTAGALWVEELEAGPRNFRGRDSLWRIVTISAANRLADLMSPTR